MGALILFGFTIVAEAAFYLWDESQYQRAMLATLR